jgi:hypothetical protein
MLPDYLPPFSGDKLRQLRNKDFYVEFCELLRLLKTVGQYHQHSVLFNNGIQAF